MMFLQPRINNHTQNRNNIILGSCAHLFNEQRTDASTGIIKKNYQYLKDIYNANAWFHKSHEAGLNNTMAIKRIFVIDGNRKSQCP